MPDQGGDSHRVAIKIPGIRVQRAKIVGVLKRAVMVVQAVQVVQVAGIKATRVVGTKEIREVGTRVIREAGTKVIREDGASRASKADTVGLVDGNSRVEVAITGVPTGHKGVVGTRAPRATATAINSNLEAGQAG